MSSPYSTMLTKLYYGTEIGGTPTQVSWVQSIPAFNPAPEGIEFSALDTDYTGQVPGRRSADTLEIQLLFTHDQHDTLMALDESTDYYWFIELPAETNADGDPKVFYFQAKARLGLDELAIDDMIYETLTLYKSTPVYESDGFPTAA